MVIVKRWWSLFVLGKVIRPPPSPSFCVTSLILLQGSLSPISFK